MAEKKAVKKVAKVATKKAVKKASKKATKAAVKKTASKKEEAEVKKSTVKKAAKKAVKKTVKKVTKKAATKKAAVKKASTKSTAKKVSTKKSAKKAASTITRQVRFSYYSPLSGHVELAGTFNNWIPSETPMSKSKDGFWTAELTLEPGQYEYKFVFDGSSWECDPDSPMVEGSHGHNNILEVQ